MLPHGSLSRTDGTEAEQQDASCVLKWVCRGSEATASYSSFLREEVLAPSDADPSAGFSLHIADIIVQELQSACEDAPVPAPALQVQSAAHSSFVPWRTLHVGKHAGACRHLPCKHAVRSGMSTHGRMVSMDRQCAVVSCAPHRSRRGDAQQAHMTPGDACRLCWNPAA